MTAPRALPHLEEVSIHRGGRDATRRNVQVLCVEKGHFRYPWGDQAVALRPGEVMVFWSAFDRWPVATNRAGDYLRLSIPSEIFFAWPLPEVFRRWILAGWAFTASEPGRWGLDLGLFRGWRADLTGADPAARQWALFEMQARVGRLASSVASRANGLSESNRAPVPHHPSDREGGILTASAVIPLGPQTRGVNDSDSRFTAHGSSGMAAPSTDAARDAHGPPTYDQVTAGARMVQYVVEHYAEPVRWPDVARAAGLSPDRAQRCFARCYGMTMHRYLQQFRLSRASLLLARGDAKVIDIAMEVGFPTLSNFYRSFEAAFGRPPSAFRKQG